VRGGETKTGFRRNSQSLSQDLYSINWGEEKRLRSARGRRGAEPRGGGEEKSGAHGELEGGINFGLTSRMVGGRLGMDG